MRGRFVTLLLLCAWCFSFSNFFLKDSNSNTHTHSFSLSLFLVWWGFFLSLFLSFFCNSPFLSFVRVSFCSFLSRVERERRKRERERETFFFLFFRVFSLVVFFVDRRKREWREREREREREKEKKEEEKTRCKKKYLPKIRPNTNLVVETRSKKKSNKRFKNKFSLKKETPQHTLS